MRTEQQMMELILGYAQKDDRVRAVAMNGSRVNPGLPADRFQDYDIVYLVREKDSFLQDPGWIDSFGPRIILQTPEDERFFRPSLGGWYSYLMLLADENRIDLTLIPIADLERYCNSDSLIKVLLDKDGLFPPLPAPSDEKYRIKKPSREQYIARCNEFWWLSTYVAKGLCRKKLLYATHYLHTGILEELPGMLSWQVGIQNDFSFCAGKCYQHLPDYLDEQTNALLIGLYRQNGYAACWEALFGACGLFCEASHFVAQQLGYPLPQEEGPVAQYLKRMFLAYPPSDF